MRNNIVLCHKCKEVMDLKGYGSAAPSWFCNSCNRWSNKNDLAIRDKVLWNILKKRKDQGKQPWDN